MTVDRPAAIRRALRDLVAERGFHGASMGAVAKAAGVATHHGSWRLQDLKRLLNHPDNVVQLDFLEIHPLIRSLEAYRIELPANHEQEP